MRNPFARPIFGPFRRRTRTGVPADHFPPARGRFGDGAVALVADGPGAAVLDPADASTGEDWWFPTEAARDAFVAATGEWADASFGGRAERRLLLLELDAAGATRDPIDGGCSATVATGDPAPPDPAQAPAPAPAPVPTSTMSETERRQTDPANEVTDPAALEAMVASAFDKAGGVDAWTKLRERKGLTAAVGADGTVEPAAWHSYLTWEGLRTDENREFPLGCFHYPDLPVSMRLLIEDDGGHWGAVTCGRIDTMAAKDFDGGLRAHYATGMFGSDPNGQLAELMVEEQTQRFVSVDMRDITCEYVEVVVSRQPAIGLSDCDDYEPVVDAWLRYISAVIGAATIVPMPAMPQAVIALDGVDLPDAPVANAAIPSGLDDYQVDEGLAASAAPGEGAVPRPPAEWFDDPGFHVGDPRLVLQSDEKSYACPLTVEPPDPDTGLRRVYGHVAWWNCDHTGFPGQRVKPPRSASSYAYYLTGPGVECADGTIVHGVGNVTMGCGHAPTFKKAGDRKVAVGAREAIAHYDGGYGAVQVSAVRAGQDDFGPWVAGYVRPGVTDEQVAEFMTLSLSGDWREIAGALDMVAVLAVPVPGFPVRRQLSASGAPDLDASAMHAAIQGDRVLALVAAGVVRRVTPEQRIASLEAGLGRALARVDALERSGRDKALAAARDRFGI